MAFDPPCLCGPRVVLGSRRGPTCLFRPGRFGEVQTTRNDHAEHQGAEHHQGGEKDLLLRIHRQEYLSQKEGKHTTVPAPLFPQGVAGSAARCNSLSSRFCNPPANAALVRLSTQRGAAPPAGRHALHRECAILAQWRGEWLPTPTIGCIVLNRLPALLPRFNQKRGTPPSRRLSSVTGARIGRVKRRKPAGGC